MQRALIVAAALLGCGGSQKSPPTTPSNSTDPAHHDDTMDEEVVEGERPANEQQLARKQAIEQARAAGILGGRGPDPQPTGALDKASIRAAVRAHLDRIELCYEQRLLENPNLTGTTRVEFTINLDGKVDAATGSGFDATVDGCVADVIKQLVFPKPTDRPMTVRYPFTFKPAP